MGLLDKLKAGLQKTHGRLAHEIKRIVTGSPKLTGASLEELEAALLGADLGPAMTHQIVAAVKKAYETQGSGGVDVFTLASRQGERGLSSNSSALPKIPDRPPGLALVCGNRTGKNPAHAHPPQR